MFDFDDERPTRSETARAVASTFRWVIGGAAIVLVLITVIGAMWIFGFGFFQRSTADFRGETAALEEILADPHNRITAYDHFFSLCASVQSAEGTIRALELELETTEPSEARVEQIQGALTANRSRRETLINEYNADASRDYTVGQFRDADLPDRLNVSDEETTCTS